MKDRILSLVTLVLLGVACGGGALGDESDLDDAIVQAREHFDATLEQASLQGSIISGRNVCEPTQNLSYYAILNGAFDNPDDGVAVFEAVRELWAGLANSVEVDYRIPGEGPGQTYFGSRWRVDGGVSRRGGHDLLVIAGTMAPAGRFPFVIEVTTGCYRA